jgi:hypothetical protein
LSLDLWKTIFSSGTARCEASKGAITTVVSYDSLPSLPYSYCNEVLSTLLTCLAGLYHLRIMLPPTYPMSAPDIMLLTPNGRFELGKKVSQLDHLLGPSRTAGLTGYRSV